MTVIPLFTASLYIWYVSRTAVVQTVCITTVNLDLLSENRNFGDLYWLEIPKGAHVAIKWTEMFFISRVPSVVIINVVTCVVIVSLSLYAWSDDRKKGSPQKQERGLGEDWWDSERLKRYRLTDRRGRRKGQKPLGGRRFSQKELLRGAAFAHTCAHGHTHRPLPAGGVASDCP